MTERDVNQKHADAVRTMRYWLLGREWHMALAAMEFAAKLHDGIRKDGVNPEFSHQIFQANYVRTILPTLLYPEATVATVFTHDLMEDKHISYEELEGRFGSMVATSTRLMSKKIRGVVTPAAIYYAAMAEDPVASFCKPVDRSHNILTMSAAGWTLDKQSDYLDEVDDLVLPMVKLARRRFSTQEPAYENVKTLLRVQAAHIRLSLTRAAMLQADGDEPPPSASGPRA